MVWLWVLLSLGCTCAGQVAQKLAVQRIHRRAGERRGLSRYHEPWLLAALLLLGLGAFFWLLVLRILPVGVAYPLLAVNFAVMALVARFSFNEAMPLTRWLGVGLIIVGVVILGTSA
jgi:undecaprenyl phosphate-alpha-L-ara4N flippase subunit ArnE